MPSDRPASEGSSQQLEQRVVEASQDVLGRLKDLKKPPGPLPDTLALTTALHCLFMSNFCHLCFLATANSPNFLDFGRVEKQAVYQAFTSLHSPVITCEVVTIIAFLVWGIV